MVRLNYWASGGSFSSLSPILPIFTQVEMGQKLLLLCSSKHLTVVSSNPTSKSKSNKLWLQTLVSTKHRQNSVRYIACMLYEKVLISSVQRNREKERCESNSWPQFSTTAANHNFDSCPGHLSYIEYGSVGCTLKSVWELQLVEKLLLGNF